MPRIALLALASLLATLPTPARAAVTDPSGPRCSFATPADSVVLTAGPLNLVDEDDPAVVHTGTVTCAITEGYVHADPDWVSVTSEPATGHAFLPPTAVPQPSEPPLYLRYCTQVDVAGTALYWHAAPDRNADGWWTTDANAPCDDNVETTDVRPTEDQPGGTVWSALATTFGEAGAACAVVSCGGGTATMSSVSLVRLPGAGARLRTVPHGWSCTDAHTGLPVVPGAVLAVPDPGVECAPTVAAEWFCHRVEVSGVLLATGLGRIVVTDSCGGSVSVSRRLTPTQGTVARTWSKNFGVAPWPLRCTVEEDLASPAEPSYAVSCAAFAG